PDLPPTPRQLGVALRAARRQLLSHDEETDPDLTRIAPPRRRCHTRRSAGARHHAPPRLLGRSHRSRLLRRQRQRPDTPPALRLQGGAPPDPALRVGMVRQCALRAERGARGRTEPEDRYQVRPPPRSALVTLPPGHRRARS